VIEPAEPWLVVDDVIMPSKVQVRFRDDRVGTKRAPVTDRAPDITVDLEIRDNVPQCRGVTISSTPDGRRVRDADLVALNLAGLVEDAFAGWSIATALLPDGTRVIEPAHTRWAGTVPTVNPATQAGRQAVRGMRPRTKTGNPDEFLRAVAAVYDGEQRAPARAVAERWAVPSRTAGYWIRQARDKGFITTDPPRGAAAEKRSPNPLRRGDAR
jgi:hypothetical protein